MAIAGSDFLIPKWRDNKEVWKTKLHDGDNDPVMGSASSIFDVINKCIIDISINSYKYSEKSSAEDHLGYARDILPQGSKMVCIFDRGYPCLLYTSTKRFVRCFWALDKQLAYARHYFAINWTESYSEYVTDLTKWYNKNVDMRFLRSRQEIMSLLAEEAKLMEIVKLIGSDVLPEDQKLVIEICKVIRVGYLQQNAFHKDDTYVPCLLYTS